MLPLRHGGVGLHIQSDEVSDGALVAGAGQAERNLKGPVAASCALPSARGQWRLHARALEEPPRKVSGGVQMGCSDEGPANGVPGQQEPAAWGAAAREEEGR